jgi:hypothetical protein
MRRQPANALRLTDRACRIIGRALRSGDPRLQLQAATTVLDLVAVGELLRARRAVEAQARRTKKPRRRGR